MKMIDVLNMMAKGKIEKDTKLIVSYDFGEHEYKYRIDYRSFVDEDVDGLDRRFDIDEDFLNQEVELIIPPKEKKYFVKFNMRGWKDYFRYLNYCEKNDSIEIHTKTCTDFTKTQFTKDELQSIQPVREFLEDMQGKYELIEVEDNEID